MRFDVEIRCPNCGATFDPREAKPYRISDSPDTGGGDLVTFDCPRCGAPRQQAAVRRVR